VAVYTQVSAADLAGFLEDYDLGQPTSFKGIAEGVENSNFLVETTKGRFFLTLYEKRVDAGDLPWFLALMTHLAGKGLPVPRPIPDRYGVALSDLNGRPACLIEFLSGVSVTEPSAADCHAVGRSLGELHRAGADFTAVRENTLGPSGWATLAERCDGRLRPIDPGLDRLIWTTVAATADWPRGLRRGTIHADLFCDNVLMLNGRVTGLIDFYFACTDLLAYDYAVTHAAWCFSADGAVHFADRAAAFAAGYAETHGLEPQEIAALPRLGEGAALRFLLTRAYDWVTTPAGAMVTKKDPMAFARRLTWYAAATPDAILGR
jgi:homoserine kinase type II